MSLRSKVAIAAIPTILLVAFYFWPTSEEISAAPAPANTRAPAASSKKAQRILPQPSQRGKAGIVLPPPQEAAAEPQRRQGEFLQRYRSGLPVTLGKDRFEILKLKAVPKDKYRPEMGTRVDEKFGFVIFSSPFDVLDSVSDGQYPVVAKPSNGMLGIVTGIIVVRLKEASSASILTGNYPLTLKYLDEDLRLAYYSASGDDSLSQLVNLLSQDSAVENVNLEIVNSKKRF